MTVRHIGKGESKFFIIVRYNGIYEKHFIMFNMSVSKLEKDRV